MSIFDKREKSQEDKFARDAEMQFKAAARRNKLIGEWASKQMKLDAKKQEEYIRKVIEEDLRSPGDDDVVEMIARDFKAAGLSLSAKEIRQQMNHFFEQARKELLAG